MQGTAFWNSQKEQLGYRSGMPGTGPQLSQIEFIVTEEQYKQLPDRERPNWHNHAGRLTPERGNLSYGELPGGIAFSELPDIRPVACRR